MNWQSIERLYGPSEKVDTVFCRLCNKKRRPVKFANTELSQDFDRNTVSHCNIAMMLTCGHIVVDDCDTETYNGRSYYTEYAWKQDVLSKKQE